MAVSLPFEGVRVRSVTNSDRHCEELHDSHTLCLLHPGQDGIGAEWVSGRSGTFSTGSGQVMVMELGEIHRTRRVYGRVAFSVVQVDSGLVTQVAEKLDLRRVPRVRATSVPSAQLAMAVMDFVRAVAREAPAFELKYEFEDMIRAWLETCAEGGDGGGRVRGYDPVVHRGIRRVRDDMHRRLSRQASAGCPRLAELAAISGLSAARFPHAFKQWLGMSPHSYFNVCRLNMACRMLEGGRKPTEVAADLGFADLPHFSRHFRRLFGVSPRAWLKSVHWHDKLPGDNEPPADDVA